MATRNRIYFLGLLAYLAILPVVHTVALRSLLVVSLLSLLIWTVVVSIRGREVSLSLKLPRLVSVPFVLWAVFLCTFAFWAPQPQVAWENLRGQWGASIFAWVLGAGGVLLMERQGPDLWRLAMASAVLVFVHLFMSLMAWSGLLGNPPPADMPVREMLSTVQSFMLGTAQTTWSWQPFPWGFRGFDPMHGNLGYTADQAIVLFMCCLIFAAHGRRLTQVGLAVGCVVICFMSMVIAYSRGAVLYGLFMIALSTLVYWIRRGSLRGGGIAGSGSAHERTWPKHAVLLSLTLVTAVLLATTALFLKKDSRWHQMAERVSVAFIVSDPQGLICNGPDEALRREIQGFLQDQDSSRTESLIQGLNSDGGRILLMRVGWSLVRDHPLGLDGSRFSYQKLIQDACGHPPVMEFAHAHQGWLDTALALGWAGSILYLGLLISLAVFGWRNLHHASAGPWAMALCLLSVFWLLRGFADSVYREHYLQMQAVLMGYLAARIALETRAAVKTGQPPT